MKTKIRKGKIADQNTKIMEKERKAKMCKASRNALKNAKDLKFAIYCRVATKEQ